MTFQRTSVVVDEALARVDLRVNQIIHACCRFEELAVAIETWATHWSTESLRRWQVIEEMTLDQREVILVALALKGSADAGRILAEYDTAVHGAEHELFCQVVRIEWESRYRDATNLHSWVGS
jgi:hypothetical protein